MSTDHNFEEKGEPKRYRTEVLPCTSLTPYRKARTARTHDSRQETYCFTSTEAKWLIRDGNKAGRGERVSGSTARSDTEDRRGRGPAPVETSPLRSNYVPRNCCFNCRTEQIGHKDNVRSTAVEKQLKQKTSLNFLSPAPPPLLLISGLS